MNSSSRFCSFALSNPYVRSGNRPGALVCIGQQMGQCGTIKLIEKQNFGCNSFAFHFHRVRNSYLSFRILVTFFTNQHRFASYITRICLEEFCLANKSAFSIISIPLCTDVQVTRRM